MIEAKLKNKFHDVNLNRFTLAEALETPDEDLVVFGTQQTILHQKHFLAEFAKTGHINDSCDKIGVNRWMFYGKWSNDPEFVALFKKMELQHLDRMAAEADRRGIEGIEKGIYWQGDRVATERQYSDNLLMFRMKRLDPAYRDSNQIQINNNQVDVKRIVYHFDGPANQQATNQLEQSEQPVIDVSNPEAKQIQG
jgi:hypothetical protein